VGNPEWILVAETLSSKHWDNTLPGVCFWSGCLSLWGIELVKDGQRIEQDLRTHPHCLVGKEYCKEITMCFGFPPLHLAAPACFPTMPDHTVWNQTS